MVSALVLIIWQPGILMDVSNVTRLLKRNDNCVVHFGFYLWSLATMYSSDTMTYQVYMTNIT